MVAEHTPFMSSLATNSIDDPAAASIYESVIGQLKEASFVSPPVDSSSYFDPVVNIEVSELNDKGISKTRYMPFKRPSEMSAADYDRLPPKHNWSPDVKKGTASILVGKEDPFVTLAHLVVGVVHAVKVYGEYGKLMKRYEMACKVVNYAIVVNRVVVSHSKFCGQRLRSINVEMLQNWIQHLLDNFGSYDVERSFQGDGDAPLEIAEGETGVGVPSHAFTDGSIRTADQLFKFHLYNIKAQKEAGLHLTSDENRAKEAERNRLMTSINRVTSGKLYFCLFIYLFIHF